MIKKMQSSENEGGSKAIWNFSEISSVLVPASVPYQFETFSYIYFFSFFFFFFFFFWGGGVIPKLLLLLTPLNPLQFVNKSAFAKI